MRQHDRGHGRHAANPMNHGKDMNGARERKVIDHPDEPISVAFPRQDVRAAPVARAPFFYFGAHTGGLAPFSGLGGGCAFTAGSAMGMRRQPVVGMLPNAMMRLAGLIRGIDVDDDERQILQMMKELVADLGRDRMGLRNRQLRIDRDIQFGVQAMPEPARANLGDPPPPAAHARRRRAVRR